MSGARKMRRLGMGLVLASLVLSARSQAGEPVVVRSSDLAPYLTIELTFTAVFGNARSVNIDDKGVRDSLKAALEGASLILAVGPEAAKSVNNVHPAAPLLVTLVPSAEKLGLDSKAQVVPMFVPAARQLKTIRTAFPALRKIGLIYDPSVSKTLAANYVSAIAADGLIPTCEEVTSRENVANAVRSLLSQVDALWLIPDTTVVSGESFRFLIQASLTAKKPVIGFSQGMTKAGAVLSIEAAYAEIGKRAAEAAKRIIAGSASGAEPPDGVVYLNAKSADMLGITLPSAVRSQAAKVFE